jgi:hypothetical protein
LPYKQSVSVEKASDYLLIMRSVSKFCPSLTTLAIMALQNEKKRKILLSGEFSTNFEVIAVVKSSNFSWKYRIPEPISY